MPKPPAIQSITPRNILSFAPDTEPIELGPLNVLIGPNGSGKSNLLEVIGLLRATTTDIWLPMRRRGGVLRWSWNHETAINSSINVSCHPPALRDAPLAKLLYPDLVRYSVEFTPSIFAPELVNEQISEVNVGGEETTLASRSNTTATILASNTQEAVNVVKEKSLLAQFRDPKHLPSLSRLGDFFSAIRIYGYWIYGSKSPVRYPQPLDLESSYLAEDLSNLTTVVSRAGWDSQMRRVFIRYLQSFYPDAEDIEFIENQETLAIFLHERVLSRPIPATLLSDGTLRWITLLAILLDPAPPSVVCIEEPDLGLHPDMMPTLAELLRNASERTQLIVTTHSEALVDALSDTPESIVVCEKHEGATRMKRLDPGPLTEWLEKYTLGQLWSSGEIGGNRR